MLELVIFVTQWLLIIFFSSQLLVFVGLFIAMAWENSIKPRLIPQTEIDALAKDWIARKSNPEEAAYGKHWLAWHRCEDAEQVKWGRIRKAINRIHASYD